MNTAKRRPLSVDANTATVLREAYHKTKALAQGDGYHYALYDYVRAVATKIAPVDAFYIAFLHGANRVRFPYGYEGGKYDDPISHTYGPRSQTAWLIKHRTTYRFVYDNGAAVNAGVMFGDMSRRSADVVTVPLLRPDGSVSGMISLHSYQPDVYDDNAVRALEWLGDLLARALSRDAEDREVLRRLPAGDQLVYPITSDHVVEYLSSRISAVRAIAEEAGESADPSSRFEAIAQACEQLQSDLVQMVLDVDDGPERRFLSLTPVEQEVALRLVNEPDNEQLAAELGRSPHTIKTHLRSIFRKYDMRTRVQVAEDLRKYLAR